MIGMKYLAKILANMVRWIMILAVMISWNFSSYIVLHICLYRISFSLVCLHRFPRLDRGVIAFSCLRLYHASKRYHTCRPCCFEQWSHHLRTVGIWRDIISLVDIRSCY